MTITIRNYRKATMIYLKKFMIFDLIAYSLDVNFNDPRLDNVRFIVLNFFRSSSDNSLIGLSDRLVFNDLNCHDPDPKPDSDLRGVLFGFKDRIGGDLDLDLDCLRGGSFL